MNHSCCWPLPCFLIEILLRLKVRLDPHDKQRIQMGLRSGNTVLISFRSGVGHFQCVLIALSADLHTNKQWQGQLKFWKYVSPLRTYFAWLPERLGRTYCSAALDKCSEIPYGEVHHLQGRDEDEKHSFVFQNIYHIGDTKSAQELESVAFGSSLWLKAVSVQAPVGEVGLVFQSPRFSGSLVFSLPPRLSGSPETYCSWRYLDTTR